MAILWLMFHQARRHGDPNGSEALPQVGSRTELQIPDPGGQLGAGNRLGRR